MVQLFPSPEGNTSTPICTRAVTVVCTQTSAFTAVLGKGWLVSKIAAALHLWRIAWAFPPGPAVRFSDARKAILLACSFFVSISTLAFEIHRLPCARRLLCALLSGSAAVAQNVVQRSSYLGAGGDSWRALRSALTTRLNDGRCAVRRSFPRYRLPGSFEETAFASAVLSRHRPHRPAHRAPYRRLLARLRDVSIFKAAEQGRCRCVWRNHWSYPGTPSNGCVIFRTC